MPVEVEIGVALPFYPVHPMGVDYPEGVFVCLL